MSTTPERRRLIEVFIRENARWRELSEQVTRGAHCVLCGSREDLHAHHVLPRRNGGTDTLDNLVAVCRTCHPTLEAQTRTAVGRAAIKSSPRRAVVRQAAERGSAPLPSGSPRRVIRMRARQP